MEELWMYICFGLTAFIVHMAFHHEVFPKFSLYLSFVKTKSFLCVLICLSSLLTLWITWGYAQQPRSSFMGGFYVLYPLYLVGLIYLWYKKGKDPTKHAVMPQYKPPKNMTAAQVAYLYTQGRADDVMAVSLVQTVADGLALLHKNDRDASRFGTRYILERTGRVPANPEEEVDWDTMIVDGIYYNTLLEYEDKKLTEKLENWARRYYTTNRLWVVGSTTLFVWILMMLFVVSYFSQLSFGIVVKWLALSLLYSFFLSFMWGKTLAQHIIYSLPSVILGSTLLIPLIAEGWLIPALLISFTSSVMSFLMYQPTRRGQALIEHLEGFRLFLKTTATSSKKASSLAPKERDKLFPYALALGLENEYKEKCPELFGLVKMVRLSRNHDDQYPGTGVL